MRYPCRIRKTWRTTVLLVLRRTVVKSHTARLSGNQSCSLFRTGVQDDTASLSFGQTVEKFPLFGTCSKNDTAGLSLRQTCNLFSLARAVVQRHTARLSLFRTSTQNDTSCFPLGETYKRFPLFRAVVEDDAASFLLRDAFQNTPLTRAIVQGNTAGLSLVCRQSNDKGSYHCKKGEKTHNEVEVSGIMIRCQKGKFSSSWSAWFIILH
ncbi:hypothetical protein BDV34DRAFT_198496 [Aspergillus parasiticus]|uniref:Uncharacterized protein n=1 Tax=Aspergillus parasiticus TaxID=5067 RepID=A0A5N6DEZ7_ASPPA|nr:hypothetical protein BDV34DRAFT_198496 [Aspergillus parasiticus]